MVAIDCVHRVTKYRVRVALVAGEAERVAFLRRVGDRPLLAEGTVGVQADLVAAAIRDEARRSPRGRCPDDRH
jgi:hypothetical protein